MPGKVEIMMLRTTSFFFMIIFSSGLFAESISITVKAKGKLTGTHSLNIHDDDRVTFLEYVKPGQITEGAVKINSEDLGYIKKLSRQLLVEVVNMGDYKAWPEKSESISVAITRQNVTKSITTRRYSEKAIMLKEKVDFFYKNKTKKK